jgi:hypothetical protein
MNNSILLNNMAVTMLQRSCPGQAFETLKDAVKITRSLVKSKQEHPNQHLLVNKAIRNIANPIHKPSAARLEAVTHDAADVDGLGCIKSNKSNLLIRIDTSDEDILIRIDTSDEDILSADNHSLGLGIFLCNFGVAASMASHKSASKSRGLVIGLLSGTL